MKHWNGGLFTTALAGVLALGFAGAASAGLLVDRGLPNANLNNAAGADRSNVAWDFGTAGNNANQWIAGDDFTLECVACGKHWDDYYRIDQISIWMIAGAPLTGEDDDFAVGDRYETISLFLGPEGDTVGRVKTAGVTAGTNDTDNSDVKITSVRYPGTSLDYQGSGGSFIQIWQIDFFNLGVFKHGTYQFAADGIGASIPHWFNHASNAALSGTPQDQADDLYRWFAGNAGMESIAFGGFVDSNGFGWDKSSDINIQVYGEYLGREFRVPEPATLTLLGLGLLGLAALRRRGSAGNPNHRRKG